MKPYTFAGLTVPSAIQESIDVHVATGRPTGDCLRAILSNDLAGAFARADLDTAKNMAAIVAYLHNRCPMGCWGSWEAVLRWRNRGGKEGIERGEEAMAR